MGVGPGDEVVVPSFTFYASAEAIPPTGATPVFCDIDPETYCVTAETVRAALTPRTKAVIAVHLFGNVAPIAEIEALGVPVLEDAAQAAGSTVGRAGGPGALGTAATFSFFPSKNLGGFGDGGMITTGDDGLAERVRTLRFHGSHDKVTYEQIGYNSRLDELQAAILRVQLPHLDGWADGRRRAGRHYEEAGLGELLTLPRATAGAAPAWHLYVVADPDVERLEGALAAAGIGHKPYYRTPVHRQEPMRAVGGRARAARHRPRRAHAPRDPDEPSAHPRAGRSGRSPRLATRCRLAPALEQVVLTNLAHDARRHAHHDRAGGTSRVTTAPAATNASSPISTPGVRTAPPPTRQARRSVAPRIARVVAGAVAAPSCRRWS